MNEEGSIYIDFQKDKYKFVELICYTILSPLLCIIGFVTNFLCFYIFTVILRQSTKSCQMYKYLFMKTICDMIAVFICIFTPLFVLPSLWTSSTYLMQVWAIYFYWYLATALFLASGLFEIAATLDCAILVNFRRSAHILNNKIIFLVVSSLILLFTLVFHSYHIFQNKIVEFKVSDNETTYVINDSMFYGSDNARRFRLTESILRDFFVLIILFLLNVSILIKLKEFRRKKNIITAQNNYSGRQSNNSTHLSINNQSNPVRVRTRAEKAEARKMKMISVLCLIYIIGHLPFLIYYMPFHDKENKFWKYFDLFSEMILLLTYSASIFIYFFFNKQFKTVFGDKFLFFKAPSNNLDNNNNNNTNHSNAIPLMPQNDLI
jgi:hypothetical protein